MAHAGRERAGASGPWGPARASPSSSRASPMSRRRSCGSRLRIYAAARAPGSGSPPAAGSSWAPSCGPLLQRLALDELQDEERLPVGFLKAVDGGDVGVVEGGEDVGLTAEPSQPERAGVRLAATSHQGIATSTVLPTGGKLRVLATGLRVAKSLRATSHTSSGILRSKHVVASRRGASDPSRATR